MDRVTSNDDSGRRWSRRHTLRVHCAWSCSSRALPRRMLSPTGMRTPAKQHSPPVYLAAATTRSHESRLYAMMHVAIHDALNAIDRRSRPYAFDAQGARPGVSRGPPSPAAAQTCSSRSSGSFPFSAGMRAGRHRQRRSRLCRRARRNPEWSGQRRGHQVGTGCGRRHSCPARRGWFGYAAAWISLSAGHESWRVSLHARLQLRVRAGLGQCHAICAQPRLAVPSRSSAQGDAARSTQPTSTR